MSLKVCLDLHDASLFCAYWENWQHLKERFPDFKLSLFFIPWDFPFESSLMRLNKEEAIEKYKENKDWIRLYPHGLTHFPDEFLKADQAAMKFTLGAIDEIFKQNGLEYGRGFCAPYWLWNKDVVKVLDDAGWWGAVDRNQPDMDTPKKFYRWSHSIAEPFWNDKEATVWKLHGHMSAPSENAFEPCLFNLLKIPQDAKWAFVDEFIETKV